MQKITITAELKSHFLRLYQIALSDENFSPVEMQLLYRFAQERDISKWELDKILTEPVGEVTIPESLEKRIAYLYYLAQMIWADKKITSDEEITLKKYIQKFGFLDENVDELCSYLLESAQNEKTKHTILKELNE
ncbi:MULTISPECIES: hypothetical protein [Flavobacteriaceae]|uniref:hypothetical protein n=1 Tax=Flavobacteriaceae TaxID=49546 RepID=UPI00234B67A8|nr:hypothetical protein [Muricauda sp. SP22]MDC6364000.1 hypothetical protein [Muricauda sp. SP22]